MGKLIFKYSVMNSGKTTLLIQTAYNYEQNNMNVLVVKSILDKKGGDTIVNRIGLRRKVDILLGQDELFCKYKNLVEERNIKCILVDEAQFLSEEQVKEFFLITRKYDIDVICYGLKTTFQAKFFSGSGPLIIWADELCEMDTICCICGKKAKFNARKVNNKFTLNGEEIAIDGFDNVSYDNLCGDCYLEYVLKSSKENVKKKDK